MGGGKGFVEDYVLGGVQGNMSDVDFKVFVGVGFTSVAVLCEGFPMGGKRVLAMKSVKGWRRLGWCGGSGWGDRMVDKSGKGGGEVVKGDVGRREVVWVVRWGHG